MPWSGVVARGRMDRARTIMISNSLPQELTVRSQRRLVEALQDPACYSHPVQTIRVIETHISLVVLTGTFVYKIKKPIDLGFLDFTTLEKRRWFCEEELRLNSRLAPEIYLAVVPIGGTIEAPRVDAEGDVIEFAVKMREFPQEAQADRVLARGDMTLHQIDALAALVAEFHGRTPCSGERDGYGIPKTIWEFASQNFAQIRALPMETTQLQVLDEVEAWSLREYERRCKVFEQRKREGRVRECHGDLHLGNVVILDGKPRVFDCIEFNPELRWIDVMSEIAFLVMDLLAAGRPDFAARLQNAYLESTGDYEGLSVLRYYLVYRAMVRAKVSLLRARQLDPAAGESISFEEQFRRYLTLAQSCIQSPRRFVAITHGFSGSGKTTLSQPLLELSGAIRVRSDVERKRLQGLATKEHRKSPIADGLYSADVTESTYSRLLDLASAVIDAGYGVIVDATFLKRAQRDRFRAFAEKSGVAFVILDFAAPEESLRGRIHARIAQDDDASDADVAVLEHQLATHEALQPEESGCVFGFDASQSLERALDPEAWVPLLQHLPIAPADSRTSATRKAE